MARNFVYKVYGKPKEGNLWYLMGTFEKWDLAFEMASGGNYWAINYSRRYIRYDPEFFLKQEETLPMLAREYIPM